MRARVIATVTILLAALAAGPLAAQATTVILVRHAEKADTTADPVLSAEGAARARALAGALARFPLAAIYVSEYRRTAETAAPTAAAQGLQSIPVPVGRSRPAQAQALRERLQQLPPGSAALVVGHSNTLAGIIRALGGPAMEDLCDADYSSLLLLELPDGLPPRLLRTSFGGPNPPDTDGCMRRMRLE